MKVFIVAATHKQGHRMLLNLGNKLHCLGTKSREKAEEVAKKSGGEVYSILLDDGIKLVSKRADGLIYNEAKRIGAR